MRFLFSLVQPAALLLVLLYPTLCNARELRLAYNDFPPLIYLDTEQHVTKGIAMSLLPQVEAKSQYTFELIRLPPKRLLGALANGQADVIVTTKDPTTLGVSIMSTNPICVIQVVILSNAPMPAQMKKRHGIIGVLNGFNFGNTVDGLLKINPLLQATYRNSHLSLIKSLHAKRIDYALDYLAPAQLAANNIGWKSFSYQVLHKVPVHFFVAKRLKNAKEILQNLDQVLPTLDYDWSAWATE